MVGVPDDVGGGEGGGGEPPVMARAAVAEIKRIRRARLGVWRDLIGFLEGEVSLERLGDIVS
jgi:hypothetical protein